MSNIIELDIFSDFGCFSKPFSNKGGLLTYLIPPKTSIIGMIGANLGYDFEEKDSNDNYKIEELYDIKISIQSYFDLRVKRATFNSHYGNEGKNMLNVKQDLLINPKYRLYISFPNKLKSKENKFLDNLENHATVYNMYMGRNEFILNYHVVNYIENVKCNNVSHDNYLEFFKDNVKVYGTLNRNLVNNLKLGKSKNKDQTKKTLFNNKKGFNKLGNEFEYTILDYPIKRFNFTNFEFLPVSFYSINKIDAYFTNFDVNDGKSIELYHIGEDKWIYLI